MSKLDDILTNATATAHCAGQDWSKANPTTQYVDRASDEAKQQIKDLFKELIGEDENSGAYEQSSGGSGLSVMDSYRNRLKEELRQKVDEL